MILFVCVGVMYSGEYDVCDVTLSVHPHRANRQLFSLSGVDAHSEEEHHNIAF
jgi:hypothetical protein